MALDPVVNFFQTEIATLPVASGGTSIVISTGDGAKLPDPAVDGAFNLTIYNESDPFASPEIVRVTAITGDTLTVTRAQEGTSATNKTAGSDWYVELTPTAKTIQDIDTAKLDVADVVNNLTSTDTDKALSANQGKVLQDGKEPADATILKQANIVDNLTSTSTTAPLSANQGKVLQDNKEPADATILKEADVVNTLVSTSTTAPLSANQGKVLQDGKLNLSGGTMTGDLTIPDKIIHSGDTNTAIRFPANDTVTVETAGVERVRVNTIGNVTIQGASTVKTRLYNASTDIFNMGKNRDNGTGTFDDPTRTDAQYRIYTKTTESSHRWFTASAPNVTATEKMRITGAGNVGIGTDSPATKLDVNGDVTITGDLLFSGAARSVGTSTAHDLILKTNNTERVRVLADGSRITLPQGFLQNNQRSYIQKITGSTNNAISINITGVQSSIPGVIRVKVYYKVRESPSRHCFIDKIFLCQRHGSSTVGTEIIVHNIAVLTEGTGIWEVTWVDKDTSDAFIKIDKPAGTTTREHGGLIEITSHVDI